MSDWYRVGVPIGARLHLLVRKPDHWQVWLAISDRSIDPDKAYGTYLRCYDNGMVERVVIEQHLECPDVMLVKEADDGT